MDDHKIEIYIDKDLLRCSNEVLTVKSTRMTGRRVKWHCEGYDYAIQFANHASPFGPEFTAFGKKEDGWTDSFTIIKQGQRLAETYKYTVAVYKPNENPPILILDPVIIVDDEGGS